MVDKHNDPMVPVTEDTEPGRLKGLKKFKEKIKEKKEKERVSDLQRQPGKPQD